MAYLHGKGNQCAKEKEAKDEKILSGKWAYKIKDGLIQSEMGNSRIRVAIESMG